MGQIPKKQTALTPLTQADKTNWDNHSNRFDLANPSEGQLIKYNATTQKWEGRAGFPPVRVLAPLVYNGGTNTADTIVHARNQFLGLGSALADIEILYKSHNWLNVVINGSELRVQYANRPENEGLAFFVFRLKNQESESENFRYNLTFQAVTLGWQARRVAVDLDAQAALNWATRRVAVDDTTINLPAATGVAAKALMADNWGNYPNVTWSDGGDYTNMRMWRWADRPVPDPQLTVVSVPKIKAMIDYWKDTHGGNVLTLPIAWDEIQIGSNQFEFRPLRWLLNYARSKGVKLILKFYATRRYVAGEGFFNHPVWGTTAECKNPFDTTAPWAFEVGDIAQDANGNPVATDIFHNTIDFWSPKVTNLENYLAAVSTVLGDYEDVIAYVNCITHKSQEMQFDFDLLSSYHPATIAAWNTFYQQQFGGTAAAPTSFSGLVGERWMAFKTYTLREFSKRCALRLKLHANVKYVLESGSFSDALLTRGNVGITAHAAEDTWLDGYKQNPGYRPNPNDLSYHDPHWSAEMMVSTGKYSVIEWTNAENIPMNTLADNVKTAIDFD